MITATLTRLPVAAGGAFFALTGNLIHMAVALYMRAPLANTAVVTMLSLGALAGSNALFMQSPHPSPLFGVAASQPVAAVRDVVPVRPAPLRPSPVTAAPPATPPAAPTAVSGVGNVDQLHSDETIGNAEVAEIQRKLTSMQLLDGAIDGIYGPQTARAIKRFEERLGIKPKGELTPALLEAIRSAPVILPEPKVQPLSTPDPLPRALGPTLRAQSDPSASHIDPLPSPAPLETIGAAASTPATLQAAAPAVVQTASIVQPRIGVPLSVPDEPVARSSDDVAVLDTEARPEDLVPTFSATDPATVARVQRGLASLGFLHGTADGIAGEATAKAIRNFEVYYNYRVTGRISPELLDLLAQNGAAI